MIWKGSRDSVRVLSWIHPDFVWFGRSSPLLPARETWNYVLPVVPDADGIQWQDGPSDFEAFNSLGVYSHLVIDYLLVVSTYQRMPPGIFDTFHQPQDGFNLTALPSTLGDLYTVCSTTPGGWWGASYQSGVAIASAKDAAGLDGFPQRCVGGPSE